MADDRDKEGYPLLPTCKRIAHRGLAARPGSCRRIGQGQNRRNGSPEARVLLLAYGSRGDIEPLAGLAVRWRELGAGTVRCTYAVTRYQRMFEAIRLLLALGHVIAAIVVIPILTRSLATIRIARPYVDT